MIVKGSAQVFSRALALRDHLSCSQVISSQTLPSVHSWLRALLPTSAAVYPHLPLASHGFLPSLTNAAETTPDSFTGALQIAKSSC